jgi:4-hydroxythreonine-4-phosphate dehydrogenase
MPPLQDRPELPVAAAHSPLDVPPRTALPIAITMGDACGIGPEIVLKALAAIGAEPQAKAAHLATHLATHLAARLIVYGDPGLLARTARRLGLPLAITACESASQATAVLDAAVLDTSLDTAGGDNTAPDLDHSELPAPGRHTAHLPIPPITVAVVTCSRLPDYLPIGQIDARAGLAAHTAIVRASQDAIAGRIAAVVTAPIHKEALRAAGIHHPGHTEILAELAGTSDVRMMLANHELRTILVTIHVSLREAIEQITQAAVADTIAIAHAGLQRLGIAHPRIAVAGLNPHAGEGGLMGREEIEIISPAIAQARARGIDASGPWPGDTVFMRARGFRDFDVVVAMYHDQGLIPVKYLGIEQGVNITVGLPFIRTSVDHGTAFDIAGRGIADASSLRAAIDLAITLCASPAGDASITASSISESPRVVASSTDHPPSA